MKREIGDYIQDILDVTKSGMKFIEGMGYDDLLLMIKLFLL
jgi:hypothetical protein